MGSTAHAICYDPLGSPLINQPSVGRIIPNSVYFFEGYLQRVLQLWVVHNCCPEPAATPKPKSTGPYSWDPDLPIPIHSVCAQLGRSNPPEEARGPYWGPNSP